MHVNNLDIFDEVNHSFDTDLSITRNSASVIPFSSESLIFSGTDYYQVVQNFQANLTPHTFRKTPRADTCNVNAVKRSD